MNRNATRRLGFSMVELLLVLALIGVLVGILIPAIQSSRKKVRALVGGNEKPIPLDGIRGSWPLVNQAFGGVNPAQPFDITWEDDKGAGGDVPLFNGSTSYMSATGFTMTSETMTIAAWVKMKSPQSWAGIAFSRAAGGRVNGLNVDGNRVKYHWNDSSATWGFSGGPTINTDEWTFIGLTIEPEQAKLYARPIPKEDETQEVEMQVATNVTNHTEQVIDELEFGRDTHSAGRKFNGYIRDIYIYDKALTEQEMIELANGGGVDLGAAGRYMSDVGAAANRSNDVLPNQ